MQVSIDYELCMGDRNCNKLCPEVFDYDEDQLIATVAVEDIPDESEDCVRRAAEECAPGAIKITE